MELSVPMPDARPCHTTPDAAMPYGLLPERMTQRLRAQVVIYDAIENAFIGYDDTLVGKLCRPCPQDRQVSLDGHVKRI